MVQANRVALLAATVAVVVFAAVGSWSGALFFAAITALVGLIQPKHHRRQILGRG